jgi:type IV pilus assembly protein PilM
MNTTVGLDIGTHTIKLIELARQGDQVAITAAGSMPCPSKAITSTIQADLESVAVAIKQLMKDTGAKSKNINIALPESKLFTRVI